MSPSGYPVRVDAIRQPHLSRGLWLVKWAPPDDSDNLLRNHDGSGRDPSWRSGEAHPCGPTR